MPGTHSQLGGLVGVVGGRGRRMVNVHLRVVCLEPVTHGSRTQIPKQLHHQAPHIHAYIHAMHANLAATKWSRSPGRARMPVHLAGTRSCASKLLENGLGTHRRTSYLLTASGVGT